MGEQKEWRKLISSSGGKGIGMGMACAKGMTERGTEGLRLLFSDLGPRKVVADFSGGLLSSDGGVLLKSQIPVSGSAISAAIRSLRRSHRAPSRSAGSRRRA
jgi:hypothetical protein